MISVIVPAYNAAATLGACLDALLGQTGLPGAYEVIVVDDGSVDATADLVRRYPPPVRLVTQAHQGAAAARNRGAVAAEGALLLFTDADCRPRPDWAAAMARALAKPGVAGAKGLFRSDQRALVARFVQAEYEEKEAQMLAREAVAFADTAAAGYRADVFCAVGGFRTDLRAVEDTELAFRLVAAGHKLVVAPDAVVLHTHPEGLRPYARRKLRYGLWGSRAYLAHPERLVDDTRTPWSMRVQLAALPLALAALAGALVAPRLGVVGAALIGLFLASALPFMVRARERGLDLVFAAPPMFALRALALDAGLCAGLLRCLLRPDGAVGLGPLLPLPPGGRGDPSLGTTPRLREPRSPSPRWAGTGRDG